jgi:two-component system secretion response regulator SsrB
MSNASPPRSANTFALTNREIEVVRLLIEGLSSKQIAARLGITFKTVVTHRNSILGKFGVHETASVVREAIRAGID